MGDQASSTITDLRQLMMRGELDNLVGGTAGDRESNAAAAIFCEELRLKSQINDVRGS